MQNIPGTLEVDEGQEGVPAEYAGFWMRLGAFLIDGLILSVIGWVMTAILFASGFALDQTIFGESAGVLTYSTSTTARLSGIWLTIWITGMVIEVLYFVGFWAWRGQTPGKIALGIKIIRADGSSLSWGGALLRYLGYIVSAVIIYIGFIWIAFDGRKQGIHDKIADTYVIRLPRKRVILPETYS